MPQPTKSQNKKPTPAQIASLNVNQEPLREFQEQQEFEIDRELGYIKGVKLCSPDSKNNRYYTPEAMKDLSKLYWRKPIRIDHDEKGYLKTVGSVFDPELHPVSHVIRGKISLNKGHPAYEQIMEDAEHRPHLLQLSHEIPARRYKATKDGDRLRIEHVYAVDCFAIVTNGGVNDSLFEETQTSISEEDEMDLKSVVELKNQYPALYEELVTEIRSEAEESEKLIEALQARDKAEAALKQAQAEISRRDEEAALASRKAKILEDAAALKRAVSQDLLEALLPLDAEKVSRILQDCPQLKEDLPAETPEKPQQRSGLGKEVSVSYEPRSNWIHRYSSRASN